MQGDSQLGLVLFYILGDGALQFVLLIQGRRFMGNLQKQNGQP